MTEYRIINPPKSLWVYHHFVSTICFEYHHKLFDDFANYHIVKRVHVLVDKDDDSGNEAYIDDDTVIFDDNCMGVDLDELEKAIAQQEQRNRNKSMDMGLMLCTQGNKQLVLVEFRLNYADVVNVKKTDLDDKVQYSTECVTHYLNEKIYPKQYFVFNKKSIQQGRERLRRMNPKCNPNYLACGVQDLLNLFFK